MSRLKKLGLGVATSLFWPGLIFAQNWSLELPNDEVAYASLFASNLSILLSIVIGIIATGIVFRAANKMGGGLFGSVLNYIGFGMVLIVLGSIFMVLDSWFSDVWFDAINTVLFSTGYIFMVIGANKLLRGIMNN